MAAGATEPPPCAPSEWGAINAVPITSGKVFAALFRELKASDKESLPANKGFHNNLGLLADGLIKEQLYTLEVTESDAMAGTHASRDPVFVKGLWFTLPCLLLRSAGTNVCDILWVHPRARRRGLGTALVKQLGIVFADDVLPESTGFWDAVDIKGC